MAKSILLRAVAAIAPGRRSYGRWYFVSDTLVGEAIVGAAPAAAVAGAAGVHVHVEVTGAVNGIGVVLSQVHSGVSSVPESALRHASYEDILDLPEYLVGEILFGQLHTHPRPAPRHARAYSALGYLLGGPFDGGISGPGGWWIIDEPEVHLSQHVVVPDLAGWKRERMPSLPDTAWFELAPDWICEILSPSTSSTDRAVKMPIYAGSGVSHLWLVDPDVRTLEVYRIQTDGRWVLLETLKDADAVRQPPFEAVEFSLGMLWA